MLIVIFYSIPYPITTPPPPNTTILLYPYTLHIYMRVLCERTQFIPVFVYVKGNTVMSR